MSTDTAKSTGNSGSTSAAARLRNAALQPTVEDVEDDTPHTPAPAPTTTTASSSSTSTSQPKPPYDWLHRTKNPSPTGTLTFIILQLLNITLQHALLHGLGAYLLSFLPIKSFIVPHRLPASDSYLSLGLTPYHTIIFLFSIIAAARQIFWVSFISENEMPMTSAYTIAGFQLLLNSANTVLSLWSRSSNAPRIGNAGAQAKGFKDWVSSAASFTPKSPVSTEFGLTFYLGIALFVLGLVVETGSELQRKAFKGQARNKGKPYGEGLFALATHINYGGFVLWRAGYAICAAKLSWGLLIGYMHGYQFVTGAIPALDAYLETKYGDAYKKTQSDVPWRLLPGIH